LAHYKTAKIRSVTSRAVDIIHSSYYINGPWRDRTNFFAVVNLSIVGVIRCYKTIVFYTFIFAAFQLNFKDI